MSEAYPALSGRGAFNAPRATHVYTAADVAEILAFASDRGVRVIPELDAPGHTTSWFAGYPHLKTSCPGLPAGGFYPPMYPISPAVDQFISTLVHEVNRKFVDEFMHVGGDEVNGDCWLKNATIVEFMKTHGLKDAAALQATFEAKLLKVNAEDGRRSIIWQESASLQAPRDCSPVSPRSKVTRPHR